MAGSVFENQADAVPILKNLVSFAKSQPDRVALQERGDKDGAPFVRLSYADLQTEVERTGEVLRTLVGQHASDPAVRHIAFLVQPSIGYAVLELAIWAAGCVAVPLSVHSPAVELAYFCENSEACVLFGGDEESLAKLFEAREKMSLSTKPPVFEFVKRDSNHFDVLGFSSVLSARDRVPPVEQREKLSASMTAPPTATALLTTLTEHSNALILYTSGTTGKPKGVVHTVASLSAQTESLRRAWQWTPDDHTLHVLPLHHIHGVQNILNTALYSGACVEFLGKFDAQACLERLVSGDVTCFHAVPTIYTKLMQWLDKQTEDAAASRKAQLRDQERIRLMVCGSAALPIPIMEAWARVSGRVLLERYGMTEIGMGLSNSYPERRYPGCVGLPLPFVETKLVPLPAAEGENENGNASRAGTSESDSNIGELLIRGPTVFKEYWRLPEETKKNFTEDGWFLTGDCVMIGGDDDTISKTIEGAKGVEAVVREVLDHRCSDMKMKDSAATPETGVSSASNSEVDNAGPTKKVRADHDDELKKLSGVFRILGRNSVDIIKSGGYKISALEVETALLSHDNIREVAVVATACETWGEKVTAVVVLKNSEEKLALGDLRTWGKDKMSTYKVPQRLEIWDELPRNQMGKVEKKVIANRLE